MQVLLFYVAFHLTDTVDFGDVPPLTEQVASCSEDEDLTLFELAAASKTAAAVAVAAAAATAAKPAAGLKITLRKNKSISSKAETTVSAAFKVLSLV